MTNLFDNTEKLIKFNQNISQQLQIEKVLNPSTQTFIDEQLAIKLGIIFNGYYRNNYGGLIPLHIAASKGFIQFTTNDKIECEEMIIEYHSKQQPIITTLRIHQVYDNIKQCMISYREAINKDYLDLEFFMYSSSNLSMPIHEAFYRGLIIGELRTKLTESKSMISINEKQDDEYENIFSSLTNITNSLSEFRNTINIKDECELTSNGFIQHKKTGKCYLLTQAIEYGLVTIKDIPMKIQMDNSKNYLNDSTLVNDTEISEMDISCDEEKTISGQNVPFFSDTFILDLLKATGNSTDQIQKKEIPLTNMKRFLPLMNSC